MTTYNGEKYIKEQIDSILLQTIQDFELIICDDNSNDFTVNILQDYVRKDKRIKLYINDENIGYVKNFEKAISLCNGNFILLSDQDDIWYPEHIEILLNNIGQYDMCGANAVLVDKNNNELGCTEYDTYGADFLLKTQKQYYIRLLNGNIFQGAASIITKEIAIKAIPFPANTTFHDWWIALLAVDNNGVKYIDIPILRYRQHGENVTTNQKFSLILKIFHLIFNKEKQIDIINYRKSTIKMLTSLKERGSNKELIDEAISYYDNLVNNKKNKAFKYFIKNRNTMFITNNKKKLLAQFGKMFFY